MKSVVSEKGQITIPKSLRERLGIKPGQVLDFCEDKGTLIARKMKEEDPIRSVYGIIKTKRRTDEIIHSLRGPADK